MTSLDQISDEITTERDPTVELTSLEALDTLPQESEIVP